MKSRSLKILFSPCHYVFDEGDRGSELSWAYQIADRIASKYPGSQVVTGFAELKTKKRYRIIELQKEKSEIDLGIVNSLKFNYLYSRYTAELLRKETFSVLHHVLPFAINRTYNFAFLLPGLSSVPKVIGPIQSPLPFFRDNLHDVHAKKPSSLAITVTKIISSVMYPILELLSQRTLRGANAVIVVNELTKRLLVERGISDKNIVIIPPGIDCQRFTAKIVTLKKNEKVNIIAVGALIERKGYDVLLKGIAEVVKRQRNFSLTILGVGPQKERLVSLIKKYHLESFVTFAGQIPYHKVTQYYQNAHIFITMSRAESFATVSLEAMASGLAIISSDVGGFRDTIRDGENGFLVKQEDAQELAKKLEDLLEHPEKITQFGHQARKDAEQLYDWETAIIPKYLSLYSRIGT